MRFWITLWLVAVASVPAAPAAAAPEAGLELIVSRPSERVLVLTEGSPWRSNHVVIVSQEGLVLVDPGGTPAIGRDLRRKIKEELGREDFIFVINHHHHWGHTWGNQAFPEALVIGHADAPAAMASDASTRDDKIGLFRTRLAEAEEALRGLEPDDEAASTQRRERDHSRRLAEGLAEEGFQVRLPDLTFNDRLTLRLTDLTIELYTLGRGHSETDTLVLVPEEATLLTGCFFFARGPIPYFGIQTELDLDRWLEVFDLALAEPVVRVIPGQFDLWSRDRLDTWLGYIADLWHGVQRLEAEGASLATVEARLPMPEAVASLEDQVPDPSALEVFHHANLLACWRQLKQSAALATERAIADSGLEAGLELYRKLRTAGDPEVFFDESDFNALGYRLLFADDVAAAIAVFELNVEAYPGSWNVYDSLGEAHMVAGNTDRAVELYRRSIEINPDNVNGVRMLERLAARD